MSLKLIAGSRGSALALRQTEWVVEQLKASVPGLEAEVKVIKTSGDKMLTAPFTQMVGKGFFTKEIEEALIAKEIDFAVHSLKDLPGETDKRLKVAAFTQREDPNDVLVSQNSVSLHDLPEGSRIGTSSPRRSAWIMQQRSDLKILPLRGNLQTRLDKVLKHELFEEDKRVDAAVLALAGLKRLNLDDMVSEVFSPEAFIPAPGQGVLAIQSRAKDKEILNLLSVLHHEESGVAAAAERSFLSAWGGGCSVPLGAYAYMQKGELWLEAQVYLDKEDRYIRGEVRGGKKEAEKMGKALAKEFKKK